MHKKEDLIGVYAIKLPRERYYIGMTFQSFRSRWNGHRGKLKNNSHPNKELQNIYNKYGKNSLTFTIVECYKKPQQEDEMDVMHKFILLREWEIWHHYKKNAMKVINGEPSKFSNSFHSTETVNRMKTTYNKNRIIKIYFNYCKNSQCNKYFSKNKAHDSNYCSPQCVRDVLKMASNKRRIPLPEDPTIIENLYWNDGLNPVEIGEIFSCNQQTIRNYMKRNEIRIRTLSECNQRRHIKGTK